MELFLIYLWLKLDGLITFAGGLAALGACGFVFLSIPVFLADNYDRRQEWYPQIKKLWVVMAFLIPFNALFTLFIPSSKDVAILVGSSLAIDMAKSPEGQKIGALLRGKANELLDAELQKLSKGK